MIKQQEINKVGKSSQATEIFSTSHTRAVGERERGGRRYGEIDGGRYGERERERDGGR